MKKIILAAALALSTASVMAAPIVLDTECFKVEIDGKTIVTTEKCQDNNAGASYPMALRYPEGEFDMLNLGNNQGWVGTSPDGTITKSYLSLEGVTNAYSEYLDASKYIYDEATGALVFIQPAVEGTDRMHFNPHFRVNLETKSVTMNKSYDGIFDATAFGYLSKWDDEAHPGLSFPMPSLYNHPLAIDFVCANPETFTLGMTVFNGPDGEYSGFDTFCSKASVDIDR